VVALNGIIRELHNHLFNDRELNEILINVKGKILAEIEGYNREYILSINIEEQCKYFEKKYGLMVPTLKDDVHISREEEIDVDTNQDHESYVRVVRQPKIVKGTFIEFAVPFEGDSLVFRIKLLDSRGRQRRYASSFRRLAGSPYGAIATDYNELRFMYTTIHHEPDAIKRIFDQDLGEVREHLELLKPEISKFNDEIENLARSQIETRKEKLLKDVAMLRDIGYPIKKYDGAEKTYAVPLKRKVVVIEKPISKIESYIPEPTLKSDNYDEIIRIISNMALVIERNPKAFRNLDEEDIRTFILMFLNGQYEGNATGETFNFEGKTDILIRAEGRNIFIAECKFWHGQEGLKATIDQLLGYTSWRDTKTAIILFNRNRNLSAVIDKIPEITKSHPNFKQQLDNLDETTFRFVLTQKKDVDRYIYLTILIFDMPIE
jgi:hypothetical protein